jgi:hypothetical protein
VIYVHISRERESGAYAGESVSRALSHRRKVCKVSYVSCIFFAVSALPVWIQAGQQSSSRRCTPGDKVYANHVAKNVNVCTTLWILPFRMTLDRTK